MSINKALTLLTAFLSYLVMAGLITQIGILIQPIADFFGISLPAAALLFSFLNFGCLCGTFVSMVIFDKLPS